jgi:hypothetical protein
MDMRLSDALGARLGTPGSVEESAIIEGFSPYVYIHFWHISDCSLRISILTTHLAAHNGLRRPDLQQSASPWPV